MDPTASYTIELFKQALRGIIRHVDAYKEGSVIVHDDAETNLLAHTYATEDYLVSIRAVAQYALSQASFLSGHAE